MATKLTKAQIIATLAEKTGLAKKDVATVMETLNDLAITEVKKSGVFVLGNLGKLVKVRREARMGRNPATGEQIQIPAKTVVKFRVAKATKEAVM
jgi:DNA-binding protein HU-beta